MTGSVRGQAAGSVPLWCLGPDASRKGEVTLSTHVDIAKSLAVSPGRCLKIRQSLLGAQGCHWGLYEIFRPVSPPGDLVGSRKVLVTQPKSRLRTRVFVRKHMVKDQHVDRQVVSPCGTELVHCEARALLLFFF